MEKQLADKLIKEMIKPIYGFALAKTNDSYTAEDLAGRIILEVYESLLKKDDIRDYKAYSMVIAMNIWKRFITKKLNSPRTLPIDYANLYSLEETADNLIINKEESDRLRREIAFLSDQQRQVIVLYYFESKSIATISNHLNIPEGTVKWHLFEARKELKMGIKKEMEIGLQGINPIKLTNMGHSGSVGTSGNTDDILSTLLSQNIVWLCYKKEHTRDEIAKELGVNPLFINDEIERLVDIGFLVKSDNTHYLTDMWIYEPTYKKEEEYSKVYKKYAALVVDLYFKHFPDLALVTENKSFCIPDNNPDAFLWSAVLHSFNKMYFKELELISHNNLAKHRSDGGKYIAFAIVDNDTNTSFENDSKYKTCGDMWRGNDALRGWQFDTFWSGRDFNWRDVKTSDFTGLNKYLTLSDKEKHEQIDLVKRLSDKELIYKSNDKFFPTICIVRDKEPQDCLTRIYPKKTPALLNLGKKMDSEISQIISSDAPAHNKNYLLYFTQNSLASPMFRPYVIEEMLKQGLLKELPEHLKSGIGVFMFITE